MYPPDSGRILVPPPVPSLRMLAAAVAFSLVLPLVIVLALAGGSLFHSAGNSEGGELGLKVADSGYGSWVINITGGSVDEDDATLVITNPSTGSTVILDSVSDLGYDVGFFIDRNYNGNLDAGDSISLSQYGSVEAGMKVQIKEGGTVLGTISRLPEPTSTITPTVGLSVSKTVSGDWLISVTSASGSLPESSMTLRVTNISSGVVVYSSLIDSMSSSAGVFNDNNGDSRLTAGDSILLKNTATVDTGMKVQLLKGTTVVGTINRLPA